ncbi:MAG: efflux RND transporter permease subunit [Anaerovoracaceae bacterium]
MLAKFSVKKPFTVLVGVILIIVFGFVSFTRMTPDLFPKIDFPMVMVMTSYPGASSEEIENSISKPLEQQLASLENLESVTSQSQKNASIILLEFADNANLDVVSVNIRDKIDMVKGRFDDSVSSPIIFKMNPDMMPITVAAISKDNADIIETSTLVEEELKLKLEGTDGVASVSTSGLVDNQIHVQLDQNKIDNLNKKIKAQVGGQFAGVENQLNGPLSSMGSGINNINTGKSQITDSQKQLASQSKSIKEALGGLEDLYKQKESMESANQKIKVGIRNANPNLTDAQIESLCMKNPTYAGNIMAISQLERGINEMKDRLAPMSGQLKSMGIDLKTLTSSRAIKSALLNFDMFIATTNAQLGNSMAELTGSSALLQASQMQLQSQLSSLNQSKTDAVSKSDVSGNLTVDTISQIISSQNFQMPAGMVSDDGKDVIVTVGEKIDNISEISNMVLMDLGIKGIAPIKIKDVAKISYLNNGSETYSKVNGQDAVVLSFQKQSDYSTTEVADNIGKKFDQIEKEYEGVSFSVLSDQGDYIDLAIGSVLNNLLIGGLLAILMLFLFLRDIRPTILTAFSIPISVTFALALMYFSGVTINMISLAGLAVGIGMLVDNSIVVIENIYRLRTLGYSKIQAAISGASQVAGAITASTLTTVCVFVPIVFVDGITRKLFADMALTVTYSLMASLIIALTLVPALGGTILTKVKENTLLNQNSGFIKKYRNLLDKALTHKIAVLGLVAVLLVGSCGVVLMRGFEFMPSMATKEVSISVDMPVGSKLEDTTNFCDDVLEKIAHRSSVKTSGVMLDGGMASMLGLGSSNAAVDKATIYFVLKDDQIEDGKAIGQEVVKLGEEKSCKVKVMSDMSTAVSMGGSGFSMDIYSDDLDDLRTTALMIESKLGQMKGFSDITDTKEETTDELIIKVDKNKAMKYGLTTAQVYMQVNEKLSKEKAAGAIDYEGNSRNVLVSAKEKEQISSKDLMNIKIKKGGQGQGTVKLSAIAKAEKDKTLNSITRIDQKRSKTINASIDHGYNITKQADLVKEEINKMELPKSVTVDYKGEDEAIMESMVQLVQMLLLGVLMVYLVMVAQFQSLRSPFIVMFTSPLAITGAMLGLAITGYSLSVVSMIGIIMLMGIIVNNAIVLIDYINQVRLEGMDKRAAIIEGGAVRLRPVIMTTLTTVLGLLPLAFGVGVGSEMMQPVAVVCIGGLVYGTLMTLFVIPIMYDLLGRKKIANIDDEELTIISE